MNKGLKIAMFGQKRLSREGGIEIVVKELSTRMAQMGNQGTCYNRSGHHVQKSRNMQESDRNMCLQLRKRDWLL